MPKSWPLPAGIQVLESEARGMPVKIYSLPSCKSFFQRVLFGALLGKGSFRFHFPPGEQLCEDLKVMLRAIEGLGGSPELDEQAGLLQVQGRGAGPLTGEVHVGSNGTLLRFILGASAILGADLQVLGDPQIQNRPLGPIADLAQNMGTQLAFGSKPGFVPFQIHASALPAGNFSSKTNPSGKPSGTAIVVDPSAGTQGASGLLIGLAARGICASLRCQTAKGDTHPYVLLTAQALASLGFPNFTQVGGELWLPSPQPKPGEKGGLNGGGARRDILIPRDPSALAFSLVVAALKAEEVFLPGLDAPNAHPDFGILRDLRTLGHEIKFTSEGLHFSGKGVGRGDLWVGDLDLRPDSFPPLALYCLFREGLHELGEAPRLRIKESDRVKVLAEGFREVGVRVAEKEGGLKIWGGGELERTGVGVLDPHGDHRMAMVFLLLRKLAGLEIHVLGGDCVRKSWPAFFQFLKEL